MAQTAAQKAAAEAEAQAKAAGDVSDAARAVLEQRIAELEAQVEQLQAENDQLKAQLPVASTESEEPAAGTNVWVRAGDGREWEVTAGSSVYERLRSEGAQLIEDPTAEAVGESA